MGNYLQPFLVQKLSLSAESWAIYDCQSQTLLAGRKEAMRREVASITKMMTFYTVLKCCQRYGIDPNFTSIAITRNAAKINGTSADL